MIKALKNYLYQRQYVKELIRDNLRMRNQLEEANKVCLFYAILQDEAIKSPVTLNNFNMASGYVWKYSIPLTKS